MVSARIILSLLYAYLDIFDCPILLETYIYAYLRKELALQRMFNGLSISSNWRDSKDGGLFGIIQLWWITISQRRAEKLCFTILSSLLEGVSHWSSFKNSRLNYYTIKKLNKKPNNLKCGNWIIVETLLNEICCRLGFFFKKGIYDSLRSLKNNSYSQLPWNL